VATKKSILSEYLAEIGRKGGAAKVRKGFAAMSEEQREAARLKSLKTRQANAKRKAGKKKEGK
jgi:hypothetical protein